MVTAEVILPSPALRPYVHHYWLLKSCDTPMSQLILPVSCLKWIFHRKQPFDVNGVPALRMQAAVVGLYEKAVRVGSAEEVEMITVFFQPYAARMVMDIPLHAFANASHDLEQLEDRELRVLKARVLEALTLADAIARIEEFIVRRLVRTQDSPYFQPLVKVFGQMRDRAEVRIDELAATACLSERQFRRVFKEQVGTSPKQLLRLQRFRQATNLLLQSGGRQFDTLLYQYGFTDHSHFNHEFHEIAGMCPTEYLRYLEQVSREGILPAYRSYHKAEP